MSSSTETSLTKLDARALTDQIKGGVEAVWHLISRAYTERAWDVLGYTSWDDYCTREFGTSRLRLPREERQDVVSSLRDSGLSLRAIESATGISRKTVIRDLAEVVESPPPADRVVGDRELPPLPENYMDVELEPAPQPAPVAPSNVVGLDGKKYPAPQPAAPKKERRKPIGDDATSIGRDMSTLAKRIDKLLADDRFGRNRDEIRRCCLRASHLHASYVQCDEWLLKSVADLQEALRDGATG